tara:strand:+ start:240 stop:419 length:180 start_codon:yes stop_codon:yes gene_type:complete
VNRASVKHLFLKISFKINHLTLTSDRELEALNPEAGGVYYALSDRSQQPVSEFFRSCGG